MKKIIAVVVSYGSGDLTASCLAALRRSIHPFSAVHICENGGLAAYDTLKSQLSRLGEQHIAAAAGAATSVRLECGDLRVFLHHAETNLGYAGGVNLCLSAIAGADWEAILVLNPDALIAPDALSALLAHAEDPNYGVIGCRLILSDTKTVQMYGGRWRHWIARTRNLGFGASQDERADAADIERQMDFVCGAAMLVTRQFIEAVGPMDETYFLYMEEVDWCFRRGDFRLGYAHGAVVTHIHGASTGASTRSHQRSGLSIYLNERNKLRFSRRFYPWHYPIILLTTFAYILLYIPRGGWRQFCHALAGWLAGICGKKGPPPKSLFDKS